MEQAASHSCRYRERLKWDDWRMNNHLRERAARRIAMCVVCGRERPARRVRSPIFIETQAARPVAPPVLDAVARTVAAELIRRAARVGEGELRGRGLLAALATRGVPSSRGEPWLETFLHAGWLRVTWRLQGTRRTLFSMRLVDSSALEDIARPGERERRARILDAARQSVMSLGHPIARDVARLLAPDTARTLAPDLVRALAAVAVHVDRGDILPLRVVSTRYLDDSKTLGRLRRRVESFVGPLETLGIREGAALVLVGGAGTLRLGEIALDLTRLVPFVGLTRETLDLLDKIEFPEAGLFIVENLTPFEACCRGEIADARGALALWSAGYPGRGVHTIVQHAVRAGRRVRVWADLDLHGVRIARLVRSWVGARAPVTAYRMAPEEIATARAWKRPQTRDSEAIRRDLEEHGAELLAETLHAMLKLDRLVEQEALLGSS